MDEDERLGANILEERLAGETSQVKSKQPTKVFKERLDSKDKEKLDSKEKNFFIPEDANVISLDD